MHWRSIWIEGLHEKLGVAPILRNQVCLCPHHWREQLQRQHWLSSSWDSTLLMLGCLLRSHLFCTQRFLSSHFLVLVFLWILSLRNSTEDVDEAPCIWKWWNKRGTMVLVTNEGVERPRFEPRRLWWTNRLVKNKTQNVASPDVFSVAFSALFIN